MQTTPIFLPGKSHGQRSLVVHGVVRVGHDLATKLPPPYLHPTKGWRIQRERTLGLTGRRSEQDGKEKRKPKWIANLWLQYW